MTATETLGQHGVVTGGTTSASAHQDGTTTMTLEEAGVATTSQSSGSTFAAGGLTSRAGATLYRSGTYSLLETADETLTLDQSAAAVLGVGGALMGGSSTRTLVESGDGGSSYGETGTETGGSSATATSSVGGQWSVSSSSDDRTADYVASSSGTSADRTSNLTATESFGVGGVVTAGFAASTRHEVGIDSSNYSETGTETGSGSLTLTYQEGGLFQSGSGWSSAAGSFESEVTRGATATLDSTGSETSGVGGILLSGGSTATYQESHLSDSYSFGQSGTLSSGNSSSATYLQGGASFSSNSSDDLTQDYSSSASGPGGHSLSRTATLTLGAGGVVTGGSAAASYHEYGSADTQSTSGTDTASSGVSFSQSIVEGGLTASANGGYSSSATLTATSMALGGHSFDRTMVESYGTGGVISSGTRTDTYREHGDADSYSLYQTGGQTGNSSSNATYRFGESSMSGTSSGDTTSNDFTMSLTGSGTHSTQQVSSLSVGSGGTISAGNTTATLHAAGTSSLAGSENAFGQTGYSSSNVSFQEGGTTLTGGSSSNVTASHGSTFGSNSTLSQDQTLHQSLGLDGTILGGDAYSTAHEDGADSFSVGETVNATTSFSSNQSSNYHEAFSAAGTTRSATLTTGYTSTGSGLHALDQSTTLALGAGGTITQGLGGTTWSGSGGGLTSSTETGTETGNASSTISFATGPDSDTASTTLQSDGGHNGGSTLGITWSSSGDSAVTLGTNGAITAGSRTATLHEHSTQSTSSLIATGSSTSGSLTTRSRFRIQSAPGTDDTSTSATNDYTQTASDSGGYTVNQSLVQDYGPAGTIVGGTATTSYRETSTHNEGLIESGSETSTIHTNYGVSTTKQDELVTSGLADRGESTTLDQSSTVIWGASGTIASGQSRYTLDRSGDGYRSSDGEGTREETNSSFAKDGDLDTTSSGTDTYSLHEVGTVTLGTNADIAGGDRDITWSQSASETHSLGFDDSNATFADELGGPSFTGSASNDESGRSSVSTAETGHHSLGSGGSITSGDTSYTWNEGRYASHALGINCSPTLVVSESGDNTFSLHETGTETLGAGGTITSGSDTFTWDQSGNNNYHLHSRSESAEKTYTLDIVDPVTSSWHDTGTESFGERGELEAATDHYTWDQGRSVTMTLIEDGTVFGFQTYDLESNGTDAISMHNVGHSTFSNNEITNSDNYSWSESSSNSATFGITESWSGGGLTRGIQSGDSYSVTVEGMESDPNTSSLSFTLDQAHHIAISANGQGSNTTFSYSFDVIDDDREYSIHATGSEIGEPGLARRSLSFTNALQEDYSQATTLSFDNGSLEYTMDQDLSAHHSATRYANSTLSGTWSSFDSHVIYENETDDSASGYVVEDPQAGQVSYDYESNGTDSIDYHHYGGGSTLSIDIDDSFFDGDSTGGIPWAVTDQYDTNVTFQSEAHSTSGYTYSKALFGVPETDIDTVHLGTSMNLGGSGNLHDLIGSVTTRSLARDANGLAAGADEIHPILELQNPYHFVLVDSMEGNGTWDASPGAWQYRRNWEVSQDEMLRSSGSNGEQSAFQSLGEEDGYGTPSNSPNAPGGRETGMASEAAQAFNRYLQTDVGKPSASSIAKPGRAEQLALDPALTTPTCMACHAGLAAGLVAYEDLTPGAQFAIARWGAPKKNFMGRVGAFLDGAIAGDFSEDDSWSAFAGQVVGGLNPAADVRDVVAGLHNVRQGKPGAGFGLFVAAVGVIPVVGDLGKAGLRGLGKLGSEGIERAAKETLLDSTRVGVHGPGRFSGAGGNWPTLGEVTDPSVIRQLTPNSCGNACAEMLLRARGVSGVLQSNIAAAKGMVLSTPDSVAAAMNKLHPGGLWRGDRVDIYQDPRGIFKFLNRNGSFIAEVKSYGTGLHMVVVDGLDDAGRVIIRDPYGTGTRYLMNWDDFADPVRGAWQGGSVWWSGN